LRFDFRNIDPRSPASCVEGQNRLIGRSTRPFGKAKAALEKMGGSAPRCHVTESRRITSM